ncbi:class II fructose-bisphosphate aldolase [Enterocloster citroniae]|uniref:class II fructose-bisphosphate aldolase n=1 Tax=Enterocloster citroniae TaxID=358743 RepID=UPI00349ED717
MYEKVTNILQTARECNTAVIAFICQDYNMARAVVCAAQAANTPAIVMLYPEHVSIQKTTGMKSFAEMVKELAGEVSVPIGLHLDHDYTKEAILNAVRCGFGSVMMDGSVNPLKRNIEITGDVVRAAHELGAAVEGEIGHVGAASDADNSKEDLYTKPDAAELFCKETGVDSLAISIGNAHGEYIDTPHLDIKRLEEIRSVTKVPLVLHGGSGIPDDQLLAAFSKGISKFNLGTEFLGKYYQAMEQYVSEHGGNMDPVKIIHMPEYIHARLLPYVENRMRTLCRF